MAVEAPNVLPLNVAAERYGMEYSTLRELVHAGVFTKHVFDESTTKPPLFVFVSELEAWKQGGAAAVLALRHELPDIGGEG